MAPALFDGLYNLAAPLAGGAQLCAEMAFDKHELEWLATQEVPGRSKRLKEMADLVRRVEEHETEIFKLHLDEQQTRLPVEAAFELDMIIKDTEKLVAKKEAAFAKVAHVWSYCKKSAPERGWNAPFEQAADNQYINLELCRARLRGLKKLAPLYRRLSRPARSSSRTLLVPGSRSTDRRASQQLDDLALEDDQLESASERSSTPVPQNLDSAPLDLQPYTPGSRTEIVESVPAQPRRASEGTRPPSSTIPSPSPPLHLALTAPVGASPAPALPARRPSRRKHARDAARDLRRRVLGSD